MKRFGILTLSILLALSGIYHFQEVEKEGRGHNVSDKIHVLNLDDWLLIQGARGPAQIQKWVVESGRVQLVAKLAGRRIASVKNKTNGFTATLFETSESTSTDFIDLTDGVNELEVTLESNKQSELTSIWLESK